MNTLKIGIVEDDLIIAQAITEMLSECGYSVTKPAKRYSEAISMIEDEAPDLLLLDVTILGKMDGIEVGRTVQKAFGIPFIFLTANTDFDTIERAKQVAPAAFLAKPITRAQLFAAIEIAIAAHTSKSISLIAGPKILPPPGVFVKDGTAFRRVLFSEILYAESRDNYLRLVIEDGDEVLLRITLAEFLADAKGFVQTHRSFAVAVGRVTALQIAGLQIGSHEVPVSRTYRAALMGALRIR